MSSEWYFYLDGQQYGPVSPAELKQYASEGQVTPETQVRKGEDGSWVPALRVKGLEFTSAPSLPVPVPEELPAHRPPALPARPAPVRAVPQAAGLKQCAFCAAMIPEAALKCQYCGETIDASLRAAEEARRVAEMAQSSAGAASAVSVSTVVSPSTTIIRERKSFPHLLHLILTVLTCGVWLPIWIIHYIIWALL